MPKPFLFLILIFGWLSTFSQETEWRTIHSVTEWLEEINNWPEPVYNQENLEILFDSEKDKGLIVTNQNELDSSEIKPLLIVNKRVVVNGFLVQSDRPTTGGGVRWFTNIQFNDGLVLGGAIDNRIGFVNCYFKKNLIFREIRGRQPLVLANIKIDGDLILRNPVVSWITLDEILIRGGLDISSWEQAFTLIIRDSHINTVYLNGNYSRVSLNDSDIGMGIQLESTAVTELEFQNSAIPALDIQGSVLPPKNSYIPFDSIRNKLCTNLGLVRWRRDSNQVAYRANTKEQISDRQQFDQLIASYYVLLDVYKARGELNSYNACYIEMRDKITARSKLYYEDDPTFSNFFAYQINRFTRAFSDYGTRPEKAIIVFFQVVLAFSIFYFFFPSSWNTTNNRKLMKRLSYLGSYFRSEEGLSALFEKETKDEYRDYEEFRAFMESSEKELPLYFKWLSRPLYYASVSRFNFSKKALSKTDILNGKWSDLPPGKKATTSVIVGLYLLVYLLYVLIVRVLNAITLSLNAFSTLGFGEIPTKGLARYVTIIQGFVGWFLLSIFLVSLIGQILN